jgi:hypothetical protein
MKQRRIAIGVVLLVIAGAAWIVGARLARDQAAGRAPNYVVLRLVDFPFTPIEANDPRLGKAISRQQALAAALAHDPGGKLASAVTVQAGFSDGVAVHDLPPDRLVWLVTFHGVDSLSSGPPESVHRVSHELSVAVDAYQGSAIVSMTNALEASQTLTPGR